MSGAGCGEAPDEPHPSTGQAAHLVDLVVEVLRASDGARLIARLVPLRAWCS